MRLVAQITAQNIKNAKIDKVAMSFFEIPKMASIFANFSEKAF